MAIVLAFVFGLACVPSEPSPNADPALTSPRSKAITTYPQLNVRVYPGGSADVLLNPVPLDGGLFPLGMIVTIDVLLGPGWEIDKNGWKGPVFDIAGDRAKIKMISTQDIVIKMRPAVMPQAGRPAPMATPTDTSIPPTVSVVTKDDDNSAPVAVDDIFVWADLIDGGYDIQLLQGITFTVIGNDTDADGHALTIDSVTQGVNGSVDIVSGFPGCPPVCGRVTYNPDGSFPPLDTFTYTVGDGYGGTDTATVRVINDRPLATKVPKPLVRPTPEGSASSYFKKGEGYNHDGKYRLAVEEFTTAIRLNPGYTSAYWARGWAYDYLNQYQQAIQDFDKAIQLDPYDSLFLAMAYDGRSKAYDRLGNHGIAGADNAKACSLDSQYC